MLFLILIKLFDPLTKTETLTLMLPCWHRVLLENTQSQCTWISSSRPSSSFPVSLLGTVCLILQNHLMKIVCGSHEKQQELEPVAILRRSAASLEKKAGHSRWPIGWSDAPFVVMPGTPRS